MCCTGQADDKKQQLVQQLAHLNASYNGGLAAYITNAKQLLQDSRAGATHGAQPAPHTDCFICIPKYDPSIEFTVLLQAKTRLRDMFQKSQMAKEWILAAKTSWNMSVKVFKSS